MSEPKPPDTNTIEAAWMALDELVGKLALFQFAALRSCVVFADSKTKERTADDE